MVNGNYNGRLIRIEKGQTVIILATGSFTAKITDIFGIQFKLYCTYLHDCTNNIWYDRAIIQEGEVKTGNGITSSIYIEHSDLYKEHQPW